MKGSDYIVKVLKQNNVTDTFGYPGATVCHLMDSLQKETGIKNHLNYHEQACAFAACGYAQSSGNVGFAYANGGPGFTNLVTGIANAYYDSIPVVFLCGQVDTSDMVGDRLIRQSGIQEIPISSIVSKLVKEAIFVGKPQELTYSINRAFELAKSGRPGPVLLEVPADIQRADIEEIEFSKTEEYPYDSDFDNVLDMISNSKRPIFLIGNGVRVSGLAKKFEKVIEVTGIPVVFTLPAFDLLPLDSKYNFGYVGNNGCRYSNYILYKSDLIISIGARLDVKVVGKNKEEFVKNAKLIRIDVDSNELSEKITEKEIQINTTAKIFFDYLMDADIRFGYEKWMEVCTKVKDELYGYDFKGYHRILQKLFGKADDDACFVADVGHHEIYMAQSLQLKENQRALFSLGLASMGYSLPASIGAYYGHKSQVISLSGDGGIQMNIQEMEYLARENIPVKVVIFNNNSLGMVREFQERNFNNICTHTTNENDYTVPSFEKIAMAYGLKYSVIDDRNLKSLEDFEFDPNIPEVIELIISEPTYLYPRYARGKRICDMEPDLDEQKKVFVENL